MCILKSNGVMVLFCINDGLTYASDIYRHNPFTLPYISKVLNLMEAHDLINRKVEGRKKTITLTDKGKQVTMLLKKIKL